MRVFLIVLAAVTGVTLALIIGAAIWLGVFFNSISVELEEETLSITPPSGFVVFAHLDDLARAHAGRFSFICADPDEVFGPWSPEELARRLGFEGDWKLVREGQKGGFPFVVVSDARRPPRRGGYEIRMVDMGGDVIVCAVSSALVTPTVLPSASQSATQTRRAPGPLPASD